MLATRFHATVDQNHTPLWRLPAVMVVRDPCPACGSNRYKKKGHTRHGKQQHQCKTCGRQLTANPLDRSMASEQRLRIEPLLRERLSLRGICRAVGVSLTGLLHCMVEGLTTCPD